MEKETIKDFWIIMSIREISTQAHFAKIAYKNINPKTVKGTDAVFSSIHSFLSHCANVSKMLKAIDDENPSKTIGDILGVSKNSNIHKRKFRNCLEHYDKELKKWIKNKKNNSSIGTYNIGPKSAIQSNDMILVNHYDPTDDTFTFVNKDFNLNIMHKEVSKIKTVADKWITRMQFGIIKPPFA